MIFPLWLIFSIFTGIASNGFNILSRYVLKDKDDPTTYGWYFELVRFSVFAIVAIFDWKLVINLQSVIYFLLLGVTEIFSIYWYMKMHSHAHLSISAILSRTRMIWIPLMAFLLIHERLSFIDYVGIATLFLGTIIISAPNKLFVDKGAMYANAAAFMIALNIVITSMALPYGSNSVINAFVALPSVLIFPLMMKHRKERIKKLLHTNIKFKTLAIGLNIISVYLFTIALRLGEASKVNAVYQGMLIISVITGIFIFKEKENLWRKVIGTTITLVGVVLLSFS